MSKIFSNPETGSHPMRLLMTTCLAALVATAASAQNDCSAGKTLTEGKLTIATGNPAYYP